MKKNELVEKYKQYENNILDDRYIIDKLIGIGGMAVVFRARDTFLNNMTVAIKILKDDVAADEVVVKRFKNESKAESMLKHNNIVTVHAVSTKGRIKYIVMEFLYGLTLKSYMSAKGEPLRFEEIVSYCAQILRALGEAHRNNIIHRDIKPQYLIYLLILQYLNSAIPFPFSHLLKDTQPQAFRR